MKLPTSGLPSGPTAFLCSRAVLLQAPRDQLAPAPFVRLPPIGKEKKPHGEEAKMPGKSDIWRHGNMTVTTAERNLFDDAQSYLNVMQVSKAL